MSQAVNELQAKLKYGFFKNPELHLNDNGVKPPFADMYIDKMQDVVELARDSQFDTIDDDGEVNNRRVVFFIRQTENKVEMPEYATKVADIKKTLNTFQLDMSPSSPWTDNDGESRISFIVHPLAGSSSVQSAPANY